MRSIALCRAVWMIHARGNSGTPEARHWSTAAVKASCADLFGQVEVAQQPNQRGDNPTPVGAVNFFNCCGGVQDILD